jgi:hypothetical protein
MLIEETHTTQAKYIHVIKMYWEHHGCQIVSREYFQEQKQPEWDQEIIFYMIQFQPIHVQVDLHSITPYKVSKTIIVPNK